VIASFAAEGTRIVMTTHNLGQARRLADEIVFIHAGRVTERTAADRFFVQPGSTEASLFLQGEIPW
jgi:tungstate transport system ATP-binding protein